MFSHGNTWHVFSRGSTNLHSRKCKVTSNENKTKKTLGRKKLYTNSYKIRKRILLSKVTVNVNEIMYRLQSL